MLVDVVGLAWTLGAVCSAVFIGYGAYLVYVFQTNASVAAQRTVAQLALHETAQHNGTVLEVKEAALGSR